MQGRWRSPLWGERIRETPILRPGSFYHHCDGLKIGVGFQEEEIVKIRSVRVCVLLFTQLRWCDDEVLIPDRDVKQHDSVG